MRRRPALALVAVASAALTSTAVASAKPEPARAAQRCGQLKGKDLLPANPSIRLVRVPYTGHDVDADNHPIQVSRSRYRICAGPNGIVHTAADVGDEFGYSNSVGLRADSGRFLAFTVGGGSTMGSYDAVWIVIDAATGHKVTFTRYDDMLSNRLPPPVALKVDRAGRVVALYAAGDHGDSSDFRGIPAGAESVLIAYAADGTPHQLDTGGTDAATAIPPSSVTISGLTATWQHGPDQRTADLARTTAAAPRRVVTARAATTATARACRTAAHAKGASVTRRRTAAVVFKRGRTDGFDRLYSCVFTIGKVRRLPLQEGTYKLGGVFFASVYEGSAIGDESSKIGVLDLRTGHSRRIAHLSPNSEGALSETDDGGIIEAYAIAASGNLVWLTTGPITDPAFDATHLQLRAGDGTPPAERIVDAGTITPGSLELATDGRSVTYLKDGATVTQPLR